MYAVTNLPWYEYLLEHAFQILLLCIGFAIIVISLKLKVTDKGEK